MQAWATCERVRLANPEANEEAFEDLEAPFEVED